MFILASASPRRKEHLENMGCDFSIRVSDAEEVSEGLSPEETALYNARSKALAVAGECPELPVLGADTVVAMDGVIYGKPKDELHAMEMLRKLSGRSHNVLTAIVFVKGGQVFSWVETTEVRFAGMTDEEIKAYVATGEPMDKAGAYAIQGRAEAWVEGIYGSWSNVVGLPLYRLRVLAGKAGIDLYGDNGEGSAR